MLSYFFITSRQPPAFTLFPYTTLFRSDDDGDYFTWTLDEVRAVLTPEESRVIELHYDDARFFRSQNGANLDRKSTRLNSSHGSISHAVFRLKKKKSNDKKTQKDEKYTM